MVLHSIDWHVLEMLKSENWHLHVAYNFVLPMTTRATPYTQKAPPDMKLGAT